MNENKSRKSVYPVITDNIGTEAYNIKLSEQALDVRSGIIL